MSADDKYTPTSGASPKNENEQPQTVPIDLMLRVMAHFADYECLTYIEDAIAEMKRRDFGVGVRQWAEHISLLEEVRVACGLDTPEGGDE